MGRFQKLEKTGSSSSQPAQPIPHGMVLASGEHATAQASDYPEAVAVADDAFYRGDYKAALRHYSRAFQAESTQVYPWIGQLNALLFLKQFKEAEVWSNRALDLFPEDPTLLSQRARVLAHNGNMKRALGTSDYAVSKGATDWAWIARAEVLLLARNPNAKYCFDKAIEMAGPGDWKVPFMAGLMCMERQNYAAAVDFLNTAAERNMRHAHIWENLAVALTKLNFTERARDAARRAQELDPQRRGAERLRTEVESRGVVERILGYLRR